MKATIALLFLTLSIVNAVLNDIPDENSQSFGQEFVEKGLTDFKKDIEDGNPLDHHFLELHEYLEKIEADNDPKEGQVLNGFNKIMNEINELMTETETNTEIVSHERLKDLIMDFSKVSKENVPLLLNAVKWLRVRRSLVTDPTLYKELLYVGSDLNKASVSLEWITIFMKQIVDRLDRKVIPLMTTLELFKEDMDMNEKDGIEGYIKNCKAINRIAKLAGVSTSEENTVEEAVEEAVKETTE